MATPINYNDNIQEFLDGLGILFSLPDIYEIEIKLLAVPNDAAVNEALINLAVEKKITFFVEAALLKENDFLQSLQRFLHSFLESLRKNSVNPENLKLCSSRDGDVIGRTSLENFYIIVNNKISSQNHSNGTASREYCRTPINAIEDTTRVDAAITDANSKLSDRLGDDSSCSPEKLRKCVRESYTKMAQDKIAKIIVQPNYDIDDYIISIVNNIKKEKILFSIQAESLQEIHFIKELESIFSELAEGLEHMGYSTIIEKGTLFIEFWGEVDLLVKTRLCNAFQVLGKEATENDLRTTQSDVSNVQASSSRLSNAEVNESRISALAQSVLGGADAQETEEEYIFQTIDENTTEKHLNFRKKNTYTIYIEGAVKKNILKKLQQEIYEAEEVEYRILLSPLLLNEDAIAFLQNFPSRIVYGFNNLIEDCDLDYERNKLAQFMEELKSLDDDALDDKFLEYYHRVCNVVLYWQKLIAPSQGRSDGKDHVKNNSRKNNSLTKEESLHDIAADKRVLEFHSRDGFYPVRIYAFDDEESAAYFANHSQERQFKGICFFGKMRAENEVCSDLMLIVSLDDKKYTERSQRFVLETFPQGYFYSSYYVLQFATTEAAGRYKEEVLGKRELISEEKSVTATTGFNKGMVKN